MEGWASHVLGPEKGARKPGPSCPATAPRQRPSSVLRVLPDRNGPSEQAGREKPLHRGGDIEDTGIGSPSNDRRASLPKEELFLPLASLEIFWRLI